MPQTHRKRGLDRQPSFGRYGGRAGLCGYEKLAGFTNALAVAEITANAQPVLADPSDPLHSGLTFMQQRGDDWSNVWYVRTR